MQFTASGELPLQICAFVVAVTLLREQLAIQFPYKENTMKTRTAILAATVAATSLLTAVAPTPASADYTESVDCRAHRKGVTYCLKINDKYCGQLGGETIELEGQHMCIWPR